MDSPAPLARDFTGPDRLTFDSLTGLRNEHLFRLQLPMEFCAPVTVRQMGRLSPSGWTISWPSMRNMEGAGGRGARAVAYILENSRSSPGKESHLVFKLSGPVFGYYIPACSAPEGRAIAEEIRDRVTNSDLYIGRLTVSLGVVNLYEFFTEEGTREEIALRIEQTAFHRLTTAERAGGNTVCDSSDITEDAISARPVVLIVDPEPQSMELLIRALEAAELTVKTCADGESAVSFIQASPPGAIICEAMTPQLNGFTVRDRMRANALWNAIPFILVSHKKTEEFIRKAVEGKILHFLKKPLSVAEVVGLVTNLTRNKT